MLYEIIDHVHNQPQISNTFKDKLNKKVGEFLLIQELEKSAFSGIEPIARPKYIQKVPLSDDKKKSIAVAADRMTGDLLWIRGKF